MRAESNKSNLSVISGGGDTDNDNRNVLEESSKLVAKSSFDSVGDSDISEASDDINKDGNSQDEDKEDHSLLEFLLVEIPDTVGRLKALKYNLEHAQEPYKSAIVSQIGVISEKFNIMKAQFNSLPEVQRRNLRSALSSDLEASCKYTEHHDTEQNIDITSRHIQPS